MKNTILFFLLFASNTIYSQIKIDGKVNDNNKAPLFGASVYIDGTTIGTTTDENGSFTITVPVNSNSVIVISYFGFVSQYVDISKGKESLNIVLTEDVKA